jgi:predicted AlkP superfamily phosphohydrolase/phosphomutase
MPAIPFWRQLGDKVKVIEVDIPLTFPPSPVNGIIISNWASHDRIYPPTAYPKEKLNWVIKNFGNPPISDEVGGLQEFTDLTDLKKELICSNQKEAELITTLLKTEEWNLFVCCFSSTHRAGHKFWDITNVKGSVSEEQKVILQNSLREIYKSCDESIGKILQLLSEDVTVLVFSLHGMGVNTTLSDKILPKMIYTILNDRKVIQKNSKSSFITKIRNLIPLEWRSQTRKLLPIWLQDKMTTYWRMAGTDWSKTKVFNLIADHQGYIRINLRGREKEGIVESHEEYDQLCSKLIDGLKTFYDEDTNEPVIDSINRSDKIFGKGKGIDNLPDVIVKWKFKPVTNYRKITSKQYGSIDWPLLGKNPDGRSGNHRPQGFLIAKGKNYTADSVIENKHIVDLAPTILKHLDLAKLDGMKGEII